MNRKALFMQVYTPLRSKRGASWVSILIFLSILAGLAFVGNTFWFYTSSKSSPNAPGVVVEIEKGQSPRAISNLLEAKGIIRSADDFLWSGRMFRRWTYIKAGEYDLSPALSPQAVFERLASGVSIQRSLTLREGENIYQYAKEFEKAGLLSASEAVAEFKRKEWFVIANPEESEKLKSLEGYLYPETYYFSKAQNPRDLIKKILNKSRQIWDADFADKAKAAGWSRHQVITFASMVEKETGADFERPRIASVFHNRLQKRMKLQSDPTTIYGIWETYKGNLRRKDLVAATPYNTYSVPALPVGPISNPDKDAIFATLYPETTQYLYFVSKNDGTHVFSKTLEEHVNAVRKYQLDPKAREGKSWRDLKKRKESKEP